MGDDNIALGRQSFLQDGMEKEDTNLLKEQHALHSLAGKRCPTAKASQAQIQVNHLARGSNLHTWESGENKLKGSIYTISILRGHDKEFHFSSRHR